MHVSIHRLLRAWPGYCWYKVGKDLSFDPQALTSLTRNINELSSAYCSFDPQALTSLTQSEIKKLKFKIVSIHRLLRAWPFQNLRKWGIKEFRSTGSYEPDREDLSDEAVSFIVSIHRLLRAWPVPPPNPPSNGGVSIHRLLRAWPALNLMLYAKVLFRSTGSYEPDLGSKNLDIKGIRFDPQALTSLTVKI